MLNMYKTLFLNPFLFIIIFFFFLASQDSVFACMILVSLCK